MIRSFAADAPTRVGEKLDAEGAEQCHAVIRNKAMTMTPDLHGGGRNANRNLGTVLEI
jgi:hypothetical protein